MRSTAFAIAILSASTLSCTVLTVRPTDSLGSKIAKHSVRLVMTIGTVGVAGFMQDDLDDQTAVAEARMPLQIYQTRSRNRAILGAALIGAAARPAPVPAAPSNPTYRCIPIGNGQYRCEP
ncbi:MAG: hypothetical protein ABIY55_12120 [Kofleriaceae bacterium]